MLLFLRYFYLFVWLLSLKNMNETANAMTSFACGIQVQSFKKSMWNRFFLQQCVSEI